jgi:hypothetical protein
MPSPWVKETDVLQYLCANEEACELTFILTENAHYFSHQEVYIDHPLFTVPMVLLWDTSDEQFCRMIGERLRALLRAA